MCVCVCMGGWMCNFFVSVCLCVAARLCVYVCERVVAMLSGGGEVCVVRGWGGAQRNPAAISGMLSACRQASTSQHTSAQLW